jgi:hypothetical protein
MSQLFCYSDLVLLRYIIIQFTHYGLGLSNGFSKGGTKNWILKVTYFMFLFTYMSFVLLPQLIKSYKGDLLEESVKGRMCLLKRFFENQLYTFKMTVCLRLEYGQDRTRKTTHTYILPRILGLITAFLWGAFAAFFRISIRRTISRICPHGRMSLIGGKKKRNILTLGMVHGVCVVQSNLLKTL